MNYSGVILIVLVSFAIVGNVSSGRKKSSPPKWKSNSMPAENMKFESVKEEESLKLGCRAQGHPKPTIKWLKDGAVIRGNTPKISMRKFYLTLNNVTTDMGGNYTCVVENKFGSLDWTFMLDVQASNWPLDVEGPKNVTQMVGANVAFKCRVLNNPDATIRWMKVFNERDANGRIKTAHLDDVNEPEVLLIKNVQMEDAGEYRCMAGSIRGLKYSSAWLNVLEPVVTTPTPTFGFNNNNNNNNNMNTFNVNGLDRFGQPYDPQNPNIFNHNMNSYYTTTRRPRKNKGRKKNKKNKKNKNKTRAPLPPSTTTTPLPIESSTFRRWTEDTTLLTTSDDSYNWPRTTFSINDVWTENLDENILVLPDTRYNPDTPPQDELGNTDKARSPEEEKDNEDISEWKIYTIVGAVGGVVLLIGLIAIMIAVCCPKQEGAVYKATPV